ncbi:MAG: TMEM43 family protein [Deltaproteobacteria bacterium]|nr:TMEM43 family protein [Deltaproteobacteria bacterium]
MGLNEDGSYTEVTNTSWSSRLGNSFKGILAGLLLLLVATGLMWWNEGRAVHTGDAIAEAQGVTVPMSNIDQVDPSFEGKVAHVSGMATTNDTVADPTFMVKTQALRLRREVYYYQWVEQVREEKRQKVGGGEETTRHYTYEKRWVKSPVNSSGFKNPQGHTNTAPLSGLGDETWYAPNVTLGAYRLPDFLSRAIGGEKALDVRLTGEELRALRQNLFSGSTPASNAVGIGGGIGGTSGGIGGIGGSLARAIDMNAATGLHASGNTIYIGRSPNQAEIGDIKVRFYEISPAVVSLIAKVSGDTFQKFLASNGTSFHKLSMGTVDMGTMFQSAKDSNATMTWILRVVGIMLAIAALKTILAPLAVLASVVPFIGNLVEMGTGLVATLLGVAWSCVVIAVAWIRFRPLLGGILLGVAALLVALVFLRGRKARNTATTA